jgi:hypothetical protein
MSSKTCKIEDNEVPLFSPVGFLEQGQQAFKMYYDTIGQEYEPTSRLYEHSQPRMALGAALTEHLSDTLVSKILNKDRTTIIHYRKMHDTNLHGWGGYDKYFDVAKYICDSYFNKMAQANRVEYIDALIDKLTQEKLSIQSNV